MHDIVRDVVISIASKDHHRLKVGRDDVFKEWFDEKTGKDYNPISLKYSEVSELHNHGHFECQNLTFFVFVLFSMCNKDSPFEVIAFL